MVGRGRVDDDDDDGGSGSKGESNDAGETADGLSFGTEDSTGGISRCLVSDGKHLRENRKGGRMSRTDCV